MRKFTKQLLYLFFGLYYVIKMSELNIKFDIELDASGLSCSIPIMKLAKEIKLVKFFIKPIHSGIS